VGQAAGQPECVTGSLPRKSIMPSLRSETIGANKRQAKNGFDARKGGFKRTTATTERIGRHEHYT
jgi:hypothetical protein